MTRTLSLLDELTMLMAVIAVCCVPQILSFLGPQMDNDPWRRFCYTPANVSFIQGIVMLCILCGFVQRKHLNAEETEKALLSKENEINKQIISELQWKNDQNQQTIAQLQLENDQNQQTIAQLQQEVDTLNLKILPLRQTCDDFDDHLSKWDHECTDLLNENTHLRSILTTFVEYQLWVNNRENDGVSAGDIVKNIIASGLFRTESDVFYHHGAVAEKKSRTSV